MIPGMNAVGMKTADRTRAIPTTGPEISFIALLRCFFRRQPLVNMALHSLYDHDGVVHHEPDRKHKAEQRQCVNAESKYREEQESVLSATRARPAAESASRASPAGIDRPPLPRER